MPPCTYTYYIYIIIIMITIKIVIYHIYHKNLISHCQDHQRGLPNIFASFCVNSWGQALSGLDFVEAPRESPGAKAMVVSAWKNRERCEFRPPRNGN